jgi:hypothetical protein
MMGDEASTSNFTHRRADLRSLSLPEYASSGVEDPISRNRDVTNLNFCGDLFVHHFPLETLGCLPNWAISKRQSS